MPCMMGYMVAPEIKKKKFRNFHLVSYSTRNSYAMGKTRINKRKGKQYITTDYCLPHGFYRIQIVCGVSIDIPFLRCDLNTKKIHKHVIKWLYYKNFKADCVNGKPTKPKMEKPGAFSWKLGAGGSFWYRLATVKSYSSCNGLEPGGGKWVARQADHWRRWHITYQRYTSLIKSDN